MKKIVFAFIALILALSLAACAVPAAETAPSEADTSTASETVSAPSPAASPTPEPTVPPSEIEDAQYMAEYEQYKMYYETYQDEFALMFIKDMVDEGKISADMLDSLNNAPYTDWGTWNSYQIIYKEGSSILNGMQEFMYPEGLDGLSAEIEWDAEEGKVHITLLDTEEKRERLINNLTIINEWYNDPTDENRIKMEDAYFSDELTLAEITIMFHYMNSKVIDKLGNSGDFMTTIIERYGTSIARHWDETYDILVEMNNTPYAEKDWCSYPERPEVLTETDLEDISGLSDAALLQYCWENYGDEYAAIQLEQLYEQGAITDNEFPQDIADAAARISESRRAIYENAAASVNGVALDDTSALQALYSRNAYLRNGKVTVSMFDSREKRERVIMGINLIRTWLQNPTNENTKAFEDFMLSDEISQGEFAFLYEYMDYYGQYLPMHIQDDGEQFIYHYLGGFTSDSSHILAQTYRQYTDYERLMAIWSN